MSSTRFWTLFGADCCGSRVRYDQASIWLWGLFIRLLHHGNRPSNILDKPRTGCAPKGHLYHPYHSPSVKRFNPWPIAPRCFWIAKTKAIYRPPIYVGRAYMYGQGLIIGYGQRFRKVHWQIQASYNLFPVKFFGHGLRVRQVQWQV